MNEIISYFFHPEASIDELLNDETKGKWKSGILNWILVAVLAGLMTIVTYKILGINLASLTSGYSGSIFEGIMGPTVNDGIKWLALAVIYIGKILIIAGVRTGIWVVLLYVVSKVLKDQISMRQIIILSIYSILTWITAQLIGAVTTLIAMISPIDVINQMLIGLGMLLGYWYLIIFIIGYSIAARSTFFKGGIIVVVIQSILWGLGNASPILSMLLG